MSVTQQAAVYQKLDVESVVDSASPHELVHMLFDGACMRLQRAEGCMERGDIGGRSKLLSAVVAILGGLQSSLDNEAGGELAENLDALYDYMQRRLFQANLHNDVAAVHEVLDLLRTLREAWIAIRA